MTTYNKNTLKTFFENLDIPSGSDYANLIDSQVNIVETSEQAMGGALNVPELITPRVSATNVNITGTLSVAGQFSAANLRVSDLTASAATFNGIVSGVSLNLTGDVSAATGTVYASALRSTNGLFGSVTIISAAGTTQATAAVLTAVVNRGAGVADGQTTGYMPLANRAGLVQYLFNNGPSANLWPPVGGTLNGLAANAALALATSAMVTIVHLTASAMAVK